MKFYQDFKAREITDKGNGEYFNATVPGNVQRDYAIDKGIFDNIQFSDNVSLLHNTENYSWEYMARLNYSANKDERVYFVAEGIEYSFDIVLDGKKLLSAEGMYTKNEIDITDFASNGSVLQIIIHPHPKKKNSFIDTRSEAVDSCKPPVEYGWDWNPRLLTSGFWLPAYIETRRNDFIRYCEAHYELDIEEKKAELHFDIDCNATPEIKLFSPDGSLIYCGNKTDITLNDVKLWWCNGQGDAALYTYEVQTKNHKRTGKIGFKNIKLVMNDGAMDKPCYFPKDQYPLPITIELNGRKIFAKGSNYVNPYIFNANTTFEENQMLIKSAAEANMNILRVWGGAGIAKPEFYDLCDEYGIMVWQEFPLACNLYTDDTHYLSVLEREATSIIKQLRTHPCLCLWCGGNELFNSWSGMSDQSYPLRLLNMLCYKLNREIPFLMTSPRCGMAHGGYTFYDGRCEVYEVFQNADNTAYTEFGCPSITSVEELKKIIPNEELFPIRHTKSWVAHHGFEAWGLPHWNCLDVIERYFGKQDSLEKTVACSSWLQCEGYKAIFEEGRRQWPKCSMALNWCFNEPWITAAGNSLIGYPDVKKPAYYAVKNALQPTLASARFSKFSWNDKEKLSLEIWYHNDSPVTVSDTVTIFIEIGGKKEKLLTWETGEIAGNTNKIGPTVNYIMPTSFEVSEFVVWLETLSGKANNNYKLRYNCTEQPEKIRLMNQ